MTEMTENRTSLSPLQKIPTPLEKYPQWIFLVACGAPLGFFLWIIRGCPTQLNHQKFIGHSKKYRATAPKAISVISPISASCLRPQVLTNHISWRVCGVSLGGSAAAKSTACHQRCQPPPPMPVHDMPAAAPYAYLHPMFAIDAHTEDSTRPVPDPTAIFRL